MSKRNRIKRAEQRQRSKSTVSGKCPACGGEGPHLVPPSMGDPGIYICLTEEENREYRRKLAEAMASRQAEIMKDLF